MSLCNLCHRRRPRNVLALAARSSAGGRAAFTAAATLGCFDAWIDALVAADPGGASGRGGGLV